MSEKEGTIQTRSKAKAETTVENELNNKEQVEFETKIIEMPNESMEALVKLLSAKFESEVSGKGAEEGIPEFDGEKNVKCWFNNFEANAAAYNWSNMQKFVFAKNKITKTAKLFLEAVTVTNYEQLKKVLLEEFDIQYSSADVHEQLRKKKKKENETFSEFVIKMRQIATMGNIDDASLIRYIVDGVSGKNELKVGMYGAQNFKELKRQYEIFARLGEKQQDKRKAENNNNNNNNNNKKKHCFNCGSANHRRAECEAEGPKCFKCNKVGHISKNCVAETVKNVATNSIRSNKNMMKAASVNNVLVLCLVDSGAEVSLVKEATALKWDTCIERYDNMILGLGGKVKPIGVVKAELVLEGIKTNQSFIVVPNDVVAAEVVLGFDIISQFRYSSDENGYVFTSYIENDQMSPLVMNIAVDNAYEVPSKYEQQIKILIDAYDPKVSEIEPPVKMKISVLDEKRIQHLPKRVSITERDVIKNQVKEWLEKGVIRSSSSEYCSRLVVVSKKDGSNRVCVDYRDLNRIVQKDRFPVPAIEEVIEDVKGAVVFSVIDLENAYFHVPVEENSKKFTAFICKEGIFEFNKAPFGFCNSPAVFLRYVNWIFQNLVNESVMQIYMDDILVYSMTEEEGIEKLKRVFNVAAENGLNIKWKKCKFLQRQVTYLGFVLENGNIKPDETKVEAINKFPLPKNIKDVQSFLGLTGFFRKFIRGYAMITEPLTAMLKKNIEFQMGIKQQTAIAEIKYVLTNKPILKIFSPTADIELHCDASKEGFGAILLQKFENRWHPVHYWSKKCSDADKKYHSYYLEVKAAYLAIKRLKHYLWGKEFTVVTDCEAFKSTVNKSELIPAVARWILYLQDFRYTIEHRKGNNLKHADALSRYPVVMTIMSEVSFKIKRAQDEDEYLSAIKKILLTQPYEDYKMIGNILYKQRNGINLIVVPRRMENEIIRTMHEKGHLAAEKTQQSIEQEYYIPHLRGKLQKIIKNCVRCILYDKKLGKKEGYLHPIEKGDKPLCDIHADHLGPMDITSKMYKYVLTIVDSFSKFVWIYPTKTTSAEETLRKLKEWTKIFGAPKRVISDRGTAFTANVFKDWCTEEQIEHVLTTTGVARGNGQVERMNRSILNILSKLSADKPETWYKYVDKTQRAINSAVNRSTKFSPFELMFGVRMKNELDITLNNFLHQEFLESFMNERNESRQVAKNQIHEAQKAYKEQFDKKRKEEPKYRVGDLVAIKRTQFIAGKKLANEFMGPYEIVKVKRKGRYEVQKVGNFEGPQKTSSSCDYMKPWSDNTLETDLSETESESDGRM